MGKKLSGWYKFNFYWIFIKLADNENMHKTLDKFDFDTVSTIYMNYLSLRVQYT